MTHIREIVVEGHHMLFVWSSPVLLWVISKDWMESVKGVTFTIDGADTSQRGIQQVHSEDNDPKFGEVNAIMHAMGYRLVPQKLQAS